MQKKDLQKICKKCGGKGHLMVYEAPRVVRKYCGCKAGREMEEIYKKAVKIRDTEPVWELFTI